VVGEPEKLAQKNVMVGIEMDGHVSILSCIEEGDAVVTSAQFLVDSESKLREATSKMLSNMKQKNQKGKSIVDSVKRNKNADGKAQIVAGDMSD